MLVLKAAASSSATMKSTSSETLAAANSDRKYLAITNGSAVVLWLGFGAAAAVGSGVGIPAGGTYEMSPTMGNLWRGAITGKLTSGGDTACGVLDMD